MFPARARAARLSAAVGGAAALLTAATGCGGLIPGTNGEVSADINVTSTMVKEGEPLPETYTCEGEGVSPPLQWSGLPEDAESLAVVVDDPSSTTVHWVLYGLDPQLAEIRQNSVPQPGRTGRNSEGAAEYAPPCPRESHGHAVRFTVYALNGEIDLGDDAPLQDSLEAIAQRTIARGTLTATGE
ncbi:phosphatidylethanolamine-binding protein [Nocardiopsis gilva YIM 90087]|uniref:Phosphatidylethanolamine-binding protein n=1 Tax=Nocardiopsis gilva YIM 90087 TaxID=1235441 RepID=A0A223S8Q5_9ACTN|nr:YbhB/YbcL family Raf kinase inhibitor-like protein [Nocardiopsis gilva]ASU84505.1 phosphatidylethanolamine-binding protein [Nocardiopsis gilva YIM 90087]